MAKQSTNYIFHSSDECERLERQVALEGIARQLRHFKLSPGSRVLDAGCGSGAVARALASSHPDSEVIGVDLNPDYVAWARNRAALDSINNVSFEAGDMRKLQFADASFDIIWSQFAFYYVSEPEVVLHEFQRILRPGGQVIVSMIDDFFQTNFPENPALEQRVKRVISGFSDVGITRRLPFMLREAGFDEISVELETARGWTILGRATPAQRRNISELLTVAMPRIVETLGSQLEAEVFLADLLAHVDHPDTYSFSPLWTIKAALFGKAE